MLLNFVGVTMSQDRIELFPGGFLPRGGNADVCWYNVCIFTCKQTGRAMMDHNEPKH